MITTFDSDEEKYFYDWLTILEKHNLVTDIERGSSFKMCDELTVIDKSSPKLKTITLLEERIYTPDFKFKITETNKLFNDINNITTNPNKKNTQVIISQDDIVYIENKPIYDQNNMTRLFRINQKEMYAKHQIFVNLIKVPTIFKYTFTPESYLTTKTGKTKKINFKVVTVDEYLKTI
jgi:hypothetical protein